MKKQLQNLKNGAYQLVETKELIASKGEQGHYSYLKALRNINMNFLHSSTALVSLGLFLC
jgi:hypothetical protein